MFFRPIFAFFLRISLAMLFLYSAFAQTKIIVQFDGVKIPVNLRHDDLIIEKGEYDLEILKNQGQPIYFLRIKKKGKELCRVQGKKLGPRPLGRSGAETVSADPSLRMKKIPEEKVIQMIFDSGTRVRINRGIKVGFKFEYED